MFNKVYKALNIWRWNEVLKKVILVMDFTVVNDSEAITYSITSASYVFCGKYFRVDAWVL